MAVVIEVSRWYDVFGCTAHKCVRDIIRTGIITEENPGARSAATDFGWSGGM